MRAYGSCGLITYGPIGYAAEPGGIPPAEPGGIPAAAENDPTKSD